jgi:hypothetical protein
MKPDSGARVREDISATQLYSFNNIALLLWNQATIWPINTRPKR